MLWLAEEPVAAGRQAGDLRGWTIGCQLIKIKVAQVGRQAGRRERQAPRASRSLVRVPEPRYTPAVSIAEKLKKIRCIRPSRRVASRTQWAPALPGLALNEAGRGGPRPHGRLILLLDDSVALRTVAGRAKPNGLLAVAAVRESPWHFGQVKGKESGVSSATYQTGQTLRCAELLARIKTRVPLGLSKAAIASVEQLKDIEMEHWNCQQFCGFCGTISTNYNTLM